MLVEFVLWGPAGLGADTYMDTLCILSNSFFSFFLLTCFLVTSQEIEKLCAGEKRERWPSGRLCWGTKSYLNWKITMNTSRRVGS